MDGRYRQILHHPRPVPQKRLPMPVRDRAAQFAPFAALTGYDEAIGETGRVVEQPIFLAQDALEELDTAIQKIRQTIDRQPEAAVTWFRRDSRKQGGCYIRTRGRVRQVDIPGGVLLFTSGEAVPLKEITDISLEEEYSPPEGVF